MQGRYSGALLGFWKVTHDGSCGNESVSPVLATKPD
jgi:hypothetical protein